MRESRLKKIKEDKDIRARITIIKQAKRLVCGSDSRSFAEYCGFKTAQAYHDRARGHLNITDDLIQVIRGVVDYYWPVTARERSLKTDTLKKIDALTNTGE